MLPVRQWFGECVLKAPKHKQKRSICLPVVVMAPTLNRCLARHAKDCAELSATPEHFKTFVEDGSLMGRTKPNYSAHDLARISVPVLIGQSEHDEFIKREHAEYLARSIPNGNSLSSTA
jgi:esterase/lipase